MLDRIATALRIGLIAAFLFGGLLPATAQETPVSEEVVPPQLMRYLVFLGQSKEVYRENFVQIVMKDFRELAGEDQLLDGSDVDLLVAAYSAGYRAAIVGKIMRYDLNGDSVVTEAELRSANAVLPSQPRNNLDGLIRGYLAADGNGDQSISAPEAASFSRGRELPSREPGLRRVGIARQLVAIDKDGDGRLTANELDTATRSAFAHFDIDGDGRLNETESGPLRSLSNQPFLNVDGISVGCNFPKLSKDTQLVVLFGAKSETLSNVTVAGPDTTTEARRILIHDGARRIYVIAISRSPIVWEVTGDTGRIERFVATSVRIGGKGGGAGVAGVDAARVSFLDSACYSYTGSDPARHVLGPLFKQLVGREPDEIVSGQGMTKSEQPDAHTVTLVPGTPKRLEEYSSHVDAETYDESLRARPGGVARIDPTKVVSPGPIARYAVLPEQAGLLQLLDTGALERLGPGRFRIIKPIERFPPGLSGARHVAFTLAPGIPMPEGDPGSSSVISEETGEILVDVATKRWKQALDPFADVRASEERF